MNVAPDKLIIIIAGPNGAGKTTFVQQLLPEELASLDFLNADIIAAELCPGAPESVAVRAGRHLLTQITDRVRAGSSFIVETTLAGRTYTRAIPNWQEAGYEVALFFLSLPSPDHSIKRVASRVAQGGHHIPENVIRRRFSAGIENFFTRYKNLVDYWYLYDNSVIPARLIESGRKDTK